MHTAGVFILMSFLPSAPWVLSLLTKVIFILFKWQTSFGAFPIDFGILRRWRKFHDKILNILQIFPFQSFHRHPSATQPQINHVKMPRRHPKTLKSSRTTQVVGRKLKFFPAVKLSIEHVNVGKILSSSVVSRVWRSGILEIRRWTFIKWLRSRVWMWKFFPFFSFRLGVRAQSWKSSEARSWVWWRFYDSTEELW